MTDSPAPNRLLQESSPYLQQHAYNPVDWRPWGDEALQAARELDRPIFLSIGYSACHWCHVMEHESFEDPGIAELMNRWFVNIKVDREERPDLDQIYMNAVLALTGRGGWPMSVFLTPERKPFYGGTYWPPESRMGMPGFRDILQKVAQAWETQRERIQEGAEELTSAVVRMGVPQSGTGRPGEELLKAAETELLRSADRVHGGFGAAPKFPHPMDLRLLLRCWKRFGNEDALNVVRLTLDKMSRGGIYDHLGGGFHRYSVDSQWLAPHFEKMLYDNALLAPAYLEAFQATGCDDDARVARETLDYVLREMTDPAGGFYSTQDADSEGEEGRFFVWSEAEVVSILGEDAAVFRRCYDVTAGGNWEGKTILNRPEPHLQAAESLGKSDDELAEILVRCREKLFAVRSERVAPARDEKILVAWNGLMISAMAFAGQVLEEPRYIEAARNAAGFILQNLQSEDGRLLHGWKDGSARHNACLDDYACFIDGLVELYQAAFEPGLLDEAVRLAETMIARFADEDAGGFFYTADDHEQLIARNKDSQDSATPSGNSTAATALLKLARITGRSDFERRAVGTLEMLSGQLAQHPTAGGQALIAVDFLLGPTCEFVVAEGKDDAENAAIHGLLRSRFLPNRVLVRRPFAWSDADVPAALRPLASGKSAVNDSAALYLCEQGACREPAVGREAAVASLAGLPGSVGSETDFQSSG